MLSKSSRWLEGFGSWNAAACECIRSCGTRDGAPRSWPGWTRHGFHGGPCLSPDASFALEQVGSDIYLTFVAVPEPSALILAGLYALVGVILTQWLPEPDSSLEH